MVICVICLTIASVLTSCSSWLQVAELLLKHGHNVDIAIEPKYYFQYSGTSLKMAAERNCPYFVRLLLKHHANPNIAGKGNSYHARIFLI